MLRTTIRTLLLVALMPASAFALGFGEIHLRSALNAPLDAEIDITASADELTGLRAALASREAFNRSGIEYPAFLSTATIKAGKSADGREVLRLQTTDPVTEPFLTMLVEVSYPRGKLVREYTVLLDPPVFATQGAAAAVMAPSTGTPRSGEMPRASGRTPPASAIAAPAASSSPATTSGGTGRSYRVQSGDTLSKIASGQFPTVDRKRALVAIYRGNPAAFEGNMNVLRAGSELALPTDSDLAAVGLTEAAAEVTRQTQSWSHNTDGARLRLVPPAGNPAVTEPAGTAAPAGAAAGGMALQKQVDQLQQKLQDTQRLLELRNAELARLQTQALAGAAPATKPGVVAPPVAAPTPSVPAAEPVNPPATPVDKPAKAAPAASAPAAPAEESLLDSLMERWPLFAGLVLFALGALLGLRWYRNRQTQDFGQSLDRLSGNTFERSASSSQTLPVRVLPDSDAESILVEETGSRLRPGFASSGAAPGAASTPRSVVSEVPAAMPSAADTATALEQGDPLAEADFHMAYGLYDQAADLVRQSIAREPKRRELKLKLLEVFFVWGNKDQFLTLARELAESRGEAIPGEWEKILIMGRQIAPEDPLFAGEAGTAGVAGGGVDLNLEGGQNRVDFNLMGEPTLSDPDSDGLDLDFGGSGTVTHEPAEDSHLPTDAGVDFVLDDPSRGDDDEGRTREITQEITQANKLQRLSSSLDDTDTEQDGSTAELPEFDGGEQGTIRLKLDAVSPKRAGGVGEQTTELALDDLGLDLGTMDVPSVVEPTLSEQSALDIVLQTAAQPQLDLDSAESMATAQMPMADDHTIDSTGIMHTMALKAIDLDVNAPDPSALSSSDIRRPEIAESPTATLPELDPPTMSEVGTKLDLARAYMDMGDPEGARSILDEVLNEGSASQKQEARRLMESLPG